MNQLTFVTKKCRYCNTWHTGQCPRIKAIEYYPDGTVKRVELVAPLIQLGEWMTQDVVNLARVIQKDLAWNLMPMLADLMEENGFINMMTLKHLRRDTHLSFCYLVDGIVDLAEGKACPVELLPLPSSGLLARIE